MHKLTRRQLLKLAGAAAGVAVAGGGCAPTAIPSTPTASPPSAQPVPTPLSGPPSGAPTVPPTSKAQAELAALYIAYCGLDCTPCAKYRGKTCEGCLGSTCVQYCTDCPVRTCSRKLGLANCALCKEYPSCQKLADLYADWKSSGFGSAVKPAQAVLEKVRQAQQ